MTLYDAYGREVDTGRLSQEQAAPTMAGVRNIFSVMHPSIGLTPASPVPDSPCGGKRRSILVPGTRRGNGREGPALPGRPGDSQACGLAT